MLFVKFLKKAEQVKLGDSALITAKPEGTINQLQGERSEHRWASITLEPILNNKDNTNITYSI